MKRTKRKSMSRCVHHQWRAKTDYDGTAVEKLLAKALKNGVIIQFNESRDRITWLVGAPGAELRTLVKEVNAIIGVASMGDAQYSDSFDRF